MPDIYYSKRSGIETERILDKSNGIKINEQTTEDVFIKTIKIGDTIYKPNDVKKKYVYIHIVELYFYFDEQFGGELKTLITIDDRTTPYIQGTEYLFFKSFGGGVLLHDFKYGSTVLSGSFYCTGGPRTVNGYVASYYQSEYYNYPFTWLSAHARINEDTIYRLEMEEL